MRKVLFLLLLFVVLGAASVSAQVRIGGDGEPNAAAVLDLNEEDDTNDGAKGLALPRVSLASNNDKLGYSGLLEGLLVYNTNEGITGGVGVYYWDGNEWVKSAGGGSTSIVLSGNSFQRAALTGDVTAAANSNSTTISNGAVSRAKTTIISGTLGCPISGTASLSTGTVALPAGCTRFNTSISWDVPNIVVCGMGAGTTVMCSRYVAHTQEPYVFYQCFI